MEVSQITSLIGIIAAILTTISSIPQVVKIYKTNETRDLSLMYFILLISGVALWIVYGVLISDKIVIFANIMTFSFMVYIIFKIVKNLNKHMI